jgi:hypothetical protein
VERREVFDVGPNDHIIGCPLCLARIPLLEEEPAGEAAPEASQGSVDGVVNDDARAASTAAARDEE